MICCLAVDRVAALNSSLDLLADHARSTSGSWRVLRRSSPAQRPKAAARERTVAGLLYRPGFTRRQGPGNQCLFGSASASGVRHELDGAADGWRGSFIVECKATAGGITKGDAALFSFQGNGLLSKEDSNGIRREMVANSLWDDAHPFHCAYKAISLPLAPLRSRAAAPARARSGRGQAGSRYASARTAASGNCPTRGTGAFPQQERWPYRVHAGEISFRPDHWKDNEIKDLLWLEDELRGCVLDLYARRRPGTLEHRAANLIWRAEKGGLESGFPQ